MKDLVELALEGLRSEVSKLEDLQAEAVDLDSVLSRRYLDQAGDLLAEWETDLLMAVDLATDDHHIGDYPVIKALYSLGD